jgi:hypothetical protein
MGLKKYVSVAQRHALLDAQLSPQLTTDEIGAE